VKKKMKKWLIVVTVICLVSVFFTGCGSSENEVQETAEAMRGDLVISVDVSGNLEMPRKVDLSFGTSGMVKAIMVEEGDRVVEGETLAKLDAPILEANVAMAELNLEQTIYPYYSYTHARDVPGIWLALDEAKDDLEEAQGLLDEGKIDEAQLLLEQVEQSLDKAKEKSKSRVWALPLSVKMVELQLDQAQAELDKTIITASFDGIVAAVYIREGQQLSAMTYANPAISLIDPSEIKMNGVIDEIDVPKVKLGQEAIVILDALPDKEVKGRITFISPESTTEVGVVFYKTTITLENPDEELKDGMSATAEIIIEQHDDVLLIPNRAIQGSWENPFVEVVTDEQIEERQISIGLSDGIYAEVLSGLEEGEEVILPQVSQLPFMF
jgi:RND family efflux transporter MFP subunit